MSPESAISAYTRVYEEEQPRLVAYARSLTGNTWVAEDLVAEAHFRVWRRLSAGHEVDNVPAYLMTTVRHLAATVGTRAAREMPLDPWAAEGVEPRVTADDPAEHVSSVDLLNRVLGQLPQRWVKALWLAEAEGVPLEDIGPRIGTKRGATAVLLHRAREGMRQAFLRAHPGTPSDPACKAHWDRMPAYVREAATPRQSEQLLAHLDDCPDCRARLAALMTANDRLPALVGPALLVFVLGGSGKFLLPLVAGSAGAAAGAGAGAGASGHGGGLLHAVRHVVTGGSKVPAAAMTAIGATVAGAAVAAGIVLSSAGESTPVPQQRAATVVQTPGATQETAPAEERGAEERGGAGSDDAGAAGEAADASEAAAEEPAPVVASPAAPEAAASEEAATPEDTPSQTEATASEPASTAPATTPTPTPTPTVVLPTPTPVSPTPVVPTPTPTFTQAPVDPTPVDPTPVEPTSEPTRDTQVCEPWHGPIYICYTS